MCGETFVSWGVRELDDGRRDHRPSHKWLLASGRRGAPATIYEMASRLRQVAMQRSVNTKMYGALCVVR